MFRRFCRPGWVLALTLPVAGWAQSVEGPEIPEPVRKLQSLAGTWRADRVEFLDEEGAVRRVSSAVTCNRLYLEGLAFHHVGRLDEPRIRTHSWFFFDPVDGELRVSSVSSVGQYDEFAGHWEEGELTLTLVPGAYYGERRFRLIYYDIGPDSFAERLEMSEGASGAWRLMHRQRFERVSASTALKDYCD